MKHLPKERRNQFILVTVVTLVVLVGLWFGLISFQQEHLARLAAQKQAAEQKRQQVEQAIRNTGQLEAALAEASRKLAEQEGAMAPVGDQYSWMVETIRNFKLSYKVDIAAFSPNVEVRDTTLFGKFPYKQATLAVGGTAYFHDFGKFIADFENQFPQIRVLNLNLEPAPAAGTSDRDRGDPEKLSFKMEIVALVKPGAS